MGDRFEETVWEYKAQILDRDTKAKGPKVWISKANSSIRVQDNDPAAEYETCEFGNSSSHAISFRVTKTNGLVFTPNRGVLKPGEKVLLKFKLPPSLKSPTCAEMEVLAIRINEDDSSRQIEDRWQYVTSNKVSRARHTVELEAPEKVKGPGRATSALSDATSQTTSSGEPAKTKALGLPVVAQKIGDEPKPRVDMSGKQKPVSRALSAVQRSYDKVTESRWLQVTLFLLAVCLVYLLFWIYSLDRRLKNIEEQCRGIFWFLPFCHQV